MSNKQRLFEMMSKLNSNFLIKEGNEYGEGEHYKLQLSQIAEKAQKVDKMIENSEDLPAWIQDKINLSLHNMDAICDYFKIQNGEEEEQMNDYVEGEMSESEDKEEITEGFNLKDWLRQELESWKEAIGMMKGSGSTSLERRRKEQMGGPSGMAGAELAKLEKIKTQMEDTLKSLDESVKKKE